MRDDMMDLVFMIVVFAIVITCGYSVILREQKNTQSYVQEYLSDKNAKTVDGFIMPTYGEFNGTLGIADTMLMTQIQDQYMPQPRTIANDKGSEPVVIENIVHGKGALDEKAYINMKKYIELSSGTRFKISFKSQLDTSDSENETKDTFYIEKVK